METFLSKLLCGFTKTIMWILSYCNDARRKLREISLANLFQSLLFNNTCESIIKIKVSIEILLMITIIMTFVKILCKRLQTYLALK